VAGFGSFLVLDLPLEWRDLVPGAVICTLAAVAVDAAPAYLLRSWLSVYGQGYGGFGIALALLSFVGISAGFWVWIAVVSGVYWEHKAGGDAVSAMEKTSARHPVPCRHPDWPR
jgi:uncharacterized BrkB/YihY/UPF0761 family membrane protein